MGNSMFNLVFSYRDIMTLNDEYIRPTSTSATLYPNEITYEFSSSSPKPTSSRNSSLNFSRNSSRNSFRNSFRNSSKKSSKLYRIPEEVPILSSLSPEAPPSPN